MSLIKRGGVVHWWTFAEVVLKRECGTLFLQCGPRRVQGEWDCEVGESVSGVLIPQENPTPILARLCVLFDSAGVRHDFGPEYR